MMARASNNQLGGSNSSSSGCGDKFAAAATAAACRWFCSAVFLGQIFTGNSRPRSSLMPKYLKVFDNKHQRRAGN